MIFHHTWQQVVSGDKTQTRRIVKPNETHKPGKWNVSSIRLRVKIVEVHTATGRIKWRVGNTYAVQPAWTKKGIARIKIMLIRRENVLAITDKDARAEGFATRADFVHLWRSMHGYGDCNVWVLDFKLMGGGE